MNISADTLEASSERDDIFRALKEKYCQQRIFYLAQLPKEIKTISDEIKLREFIPTNLTYKKC